MLRTFAVFATVLATVVFLPFEAIAAGRHADPELETLLPDTLGGAALVIESQTGAELSDNSTAFDTFLHELGKTRADFTIASAYAQDSLRAEVGAWRVKGADPTLLLPGFEKALQASSAVPLTNLQKTMANRQVLRIGAPGQLAHGPLYVIVHGDALLFVQTPEPALAEEAMEKLPR